MLKVNDDNFISSQGMLYSPSVNIASALVIFNLAVDKLLSLLFYFSCEVFHYHISLAFFTIDVRWSTIVSANIKHATAGNRKIFATLP